MSLTDGGVTLVRMGDGIAFRVMCPYSLFKRRWARALVGGRWHGFWWRFHRRIGVRVRVRVRLLRVVCRDRDGKLRVRYLNPGQITYAEPSAPSVR